MIGTLAGGAHRRRRGARARAGADDDQHGAAPPGHPRGAAAPGEPRGRGRPGPEADRRLRPHRHREELRGQVLLEGDPVRGADGLPLLLLQHGGVRRLRGAAAGARDPAARQVPAGDPPGAEPDPLAPGLARDLRPRPRRDVDVLLLLPRPRPGPRPVRDVDRTADAHPLLPGRRRLRGHPGRLRAQGARLLRGDALADRPVRGDPEPQRDLPAAHQERRDRPAPAAARPGRHRAAAAGRRRAVGPAQGRAHRSPTATSTSRSRSARSATATTATGFASQEMRESVRIVEQALDGPARGPVDRRRPQGRAAAARRALDLDGGADPPLQAGHRGLPGAAGRGLLRGRVAARGARLLRARRRLGEAGPGPHPRPLVREPAGASRHVRRRLHRRPDPEPGDARPDPRGDRSDERAFRRSDRPTRCPPRSASGWSSRCGPRTPSRFPSFTRSTSRTSSGSRSRPRCRATRRSAPPRFRPCGPSSATTAGARRRASARRPR